MIDDAYAEGMDLSEDEELMKKQLMRLVAGGGGSDVSNDQGYNNADKNITYIKQMGNQNDN